MLLNSKCKSMSETEPVRMISLLLISSSEQIRKHIRAKKAECQKIWVVGNRIGHLHAGLTVFSLKCYIAVSPPSFITMYNITILSDETWKICAISNSEGSNMPHALYIYEKNTENFPFTLHMF